MPLLRLALLSTFTCPLLFSATLASEPEDTSLVIYNAGIGLVHEHKTLTVEKGEQSIVYPGVATTVQTDSVHVRLPDGLILYSQQYRFDKITLGKIIEAHIGKPVRYTSGPKEKPVLEEGILLAADPAVVRTKEGIVSGIDAGDFVFDTIPSTLIMQPSLVWNVEAVRRTSGTLQLDYLLSGIRWKSDYILNLHENDGDLAGWVTVDNRSGRRFDAVRLTLLAGDINRVAAPKRAFDLMQAERTAAAPEVAERSHEGYHLYAVPFRVTLANNEQTQIAFIDRPRHGLKRLYDVRMQSPFGTAETKKIPVSQSVELSEFPMPLPGGIVRTYSETDGTTVLLGETRLANTPKNEKVKLRIGTNFDLIAENVLVERSDDSRYYGAKVAYTLTNRSDAAKTVDVDIPGIAVQTQAQTSVTTELPYTRPDGYTLRFTITLGAGETKTWQAAYRSRKDLPAR